MENPKPTTKKIYAWVKATVGSLGYNATCTRYDVTYAASWCVQFLENPTQGTVEAIRWRWIMAYLDRLAGTLKRRLTLRGSEWGGGVGDVFGLRSRRGYV